MEQWIKRVGSALCASLLTVTLNTGVFADLDDKDPDPLDPPNPIVEPVDGDLAPSDDDNDGEKKPSSDDDDAAPGKKGGAPSDNDDDNDDDDDIDDDDNDDDDDIDDDDNDDDDDDDNDADDNDDDDNDDDDDDDNDDDDDDIDDDDNDDDDDIDDDNDDDDDDDNDDDDNDDDDIDDNDDDNDDGKKKNVSSGDRSAAPNTKAAGNRNASGTDEGGESGNGESGDTEDMFYQMEDGSYVLLNHDGTEALSADGDITILAAGVNHLSSISGTNKVRIAGTGILIVDDFQGTLESLTFTDIYEEGSVAVFALQGDGNYHMLNGRVPGILDEDYLIKGYKLVMPENTTLLLCGTGATLQEDNTVLYYHGTDHGINSADPFSYIETTGNLTIGSGATLVVSEGASILLQNLRSVGGTDTLDGIRYPTLNTENGGKLVVDGTVGDGGFVNINGDAGALSGSGSVTAHSISVNDPGNVNGSTVTLSASELNLSGSGSYDALHIKDSTVHLSSGSVSFDDLNTSGNTTFIFSAGCAFDLDTVDGSLTLRLNKAYEDGNNDRDLCPISGQVEGSGTINLYAGIFSLDSAMTLDGVTLSDGSAALIYDYAGLCGTSLTPLRIQPQYAPIPAATEDGVKISVVSSKLFEFIHHVDEFSFDGALPSTTIDAVRDQSGHLSLDLGALKTLAQTSKAAVQAEESGYYGMVVELLHMDQDGNFSTSFYNASALTGTVCADDICLVRITYYSPVYGQDPLSTPTQTGFTFTGSGILGGSGAGSVSYGSTHTDPVDPAEPDPDEPDPDEPDPEEDETEEEETEEETDETENDGATADLWVEDTEDECYVLHAAEGLQTLAEHGGKVTVSLRYTLPAKYAGKPLYAVFLTDNGTLKAFRASYDELNGKLSFGTDCLGRFMIVGFDFDGEEFSEDFYQALLALSDLAPLL